NLYSWGSSSFLLLYSFFIYAIIGLNNMKWVTYEGKGDIESYSAAILNHDHESALAISSVEKSPRSIAIYLENRSSVVETLLFARPKSIVLTLMQNGDFVIISNYIILHSWYIAIILLSSIAWPSLLIFSFSALYSTPTIAVFLALLAFWLLFTSHFLLTGSAYQIGVILEVLQSAARVRNEVLTKMYSPRRSSFNRILIFYTAYVLTIFFVILTLNHKAFFGNNGIVLIMMTVGVTSMLFVAFIPILHRRAIPVYLRFNQMVPNFSFLFGFICLSVIFSMWSFPTKQIGLEKLNVLAATLSVLDSSSSSSSSSAAAAAALFEASIYANWLRNRTIGMVLLIATFITMGIRSFVTGIRMAVTFTFPASRRLTLFSGKNPTITEAASGRGFLSIFRLILGWWWLTFSVIFLWLIAINATAFISALVGPEKLSVFPTSQWILVSQRLLSLLVTGKLNSDAVMACVRIGWLIGCGLTVLIVGISIYQLISQRQEQYRDLLDQANGDDYASKVINDMDGLFCMEPPRISIIDTKDINAWAYEFGLFRRQRFVKITSGVIEQERLTPGFLRFVIGHELSHLRLGHVSRLNWLRWLGRLTLVGDTFVLTFFNSWGCEEAADLYVLRKMNIPRYAIIGCLEILQQHNFRRFKNDKRMSGYADDDSERAISLERTKVHRRTIKDYIRAFIDQYTNPFNHSYWHPDIKCRIENISVRK
ncbi:M48 family metalloprotease, partial [Desulfocicer niacini]